MNLVKMYCQSKVVYVRESSLLNPQRNHLELFDKHGVSKDSIALKQLLGTTKKHSEALYAAS